MTRVWLAAYPRSGVTFLRLVLEAMYGVKTYTVYPPEEDHKAVSDLFSLDRAAHCDIPDGDGYAFIKTHEVEHVTAKGPAIHLVRDGRDALVSQAHFQLAYAPINSAGLSFNEVLRRLILGTLPRAAGSPDPPWNWSEHTGAWAGRADTATLWFERLVDAGGPWLPVMYTMDAIGLTFDEIEPNNEKAVPRFSDLHARSPKFFRSGKVGQWREEMSEELHELFWEHHGEAMDYVGYKREAVCLSS